MQYSTKVQAISFQILLILTCYVANLLLCKNRDFSWLNNVLKSLSVLKWGSYMNNWIGPKSNHKREAGRNFTATQNREWCEHRIKMVTLKFGVMWAQANKCQQSPDTSRGKNNISPRSFWESMISIQWYWFQNLGREL